MNLSTKEIEHIYSVFLKSKGVNTDSRKIKAGEIFWAIKGEYFDGNIFVKDSLTKGAIMAVTDDITFKNYPDKNICYVKNSLLALTEIAGHHREQCDFYIISITGSNGKTTTKELCQAVLESQYKTSCTPGNFNNEIGVPLTLLGFPIDTKFGIVELGARKTGDIKYLCEFVTPNAAIITNFGKDHLEVFGSVENIIKTNTEVLDYLSTSDHLLYMNIDDEKMKNYSTGSYTTITFGSSDQADFQGKILKNDSPFFHFEFLTEKNICRVKSQLTGNYNFYNFMTAVAVGLNQGVPPEKIVTALESYAPKSNRSQVKIVGTNTFIMDAYNANPDSMRAALLNFQQLNSQKKWIILGDMLELGEYSDTEHSEILKLAMSLNPEKLILVGDCFPVKKINNTHYFKHTADLKEWWEKNSPENTYILLKGSRGIALEKLLDAEY